MALVYVDDLDAPALAPDDAHHLGSVRRLRPGEPVVASDGAGRYRECSAAGDGRQVRLEATGEIRTEPAPAPSLTVAMSLAKADRTEWAAAKLTELGVDRIVPLLCDRTVVSAKTFRADRLQRILRESAMQARRAWLPQLDEPIGLAEMLATAGGTAGTARMVLAEPGGGPLTLATPTVLVGPEGGWTGRELDLANEFGVSTVGLGPTILRIETAAVAAGTLLSALRSGRV